MRTQFSKIALAAGFLLAITFTLSCGEHSGGDDGGTSSSSTEISSSGGTLASSSSGTGGNQSSSSGTATTPSSSGGGESSSSSKSSSSGNTFVGENGEFKDSRDTNTYKWVKIGTQTWMAENLNYKEIPIASTRISVCYNGQESNCDKYGRLYEWDVAVEVCPEGWHLPNASDWNILKNYVGTNPGTKLKAASTDWGESKGTDNYGFGALPGGILRTASKESYDFVDKDIAGYWWTSSEMNDNQANRVKMDTLAGVDVGRGTDLVYTDHWVYEGDKLHKLSVRCILGSSSSASIAYENLVDERDNKTYRTVKIGSKKWMAENLNHEAENSQCYDNKESNCGKYGRLYNWTTAKTVCPKGWGLPTSSEWNALISYVGAVPGRKLKAKNDIWGSDYGTNIYGFGALPGGILRTASKESYEFTDMGIAGYWWTSSEMNDNQANRAMMDRGDGINVGRGPDLVYIDHWVYEGEKPHKLSVRCVED